MCQRYRVCSPASLVWLFGECVEVDEVISAGGVCVASSVWCPLRWLNLLVRASSFKCGKKCDIGYLFFMRSPGRHGVCSDDVINRPGLENTQTDKTIKLRLFAHGK